MVQARSAILIAGPTASGKSALALDMAEKTNGIIVNADSMQVYDVLHILTARPGKEELARAPHFLYGHVSPANTYSAAAWIADVKSLLESEDARERTIIFAGGTGLYFQALEGGLSDIPAIPARIRDRWRYRLSEEGPGRLHRLLRMYDPQSASVIKAGDSQRIVRALEVHEATGKPISHWWSRRGDGLAHPQRTRKILMCPERDVLVSRIERRFDAMVSNGALDEVRKLLSLGLNKDMPAMKAIGVRELGSSLEGRITLEEAIVRAKAATRQYAKRQLTWFRNRAGKGWERI